MNGYVDFTRPFYVILKKNNCKIFRCDYEKITFLKNYFFFYNFFIVKYCFTFTVLYNEFFQHTIYKFSKVKFTFFFHVNLTISG